VKQRILYVQYTNPAAYPPLEHSSRIIADNGWEVLVLGLGADGAGALGFQPHDNVTVRQLSYCAPGVRQKMHYMRFCLWVAGWILAWRPGWLYASDPLACPIALAMSVIPGLRIIYHEHDSPPMVPKSRFDRCALLMRRLLAGRARCVILPNQQRVLQFASDVRTSRSNVVCVWNCPTRDEISDQRSPVDVAKIRLLYHGSIVPSRLPLAVLYALARLPENLVLRIVGYETIGSRGYLDVIRDKAKSLGVTDRVEVVGTLARRELLERCRESDIGLAVMPMSSGDLNMRAMVGASNKAFDYLASGLALIVSDLPEWRTMFVDRGYGVACNPQDPDSISGALQSLLADPAGMRMMGERGRQRIEQEWNYETEFSKVSELLSNDSTPLMQPELTRS
jgi:glycosyltransferase involved in cell wall biosynthesis